MLKSVHRPQSLHKRRRISANGVDTFLSCQISSQVKTSLPTLRCPYYYTKPCLSELAIQELKDPGFCSRVLDFTVGRVGYSWVKFVGETDIRCLDLDRTIKFNRCEVIVYEDESSKPVVGQGLNKEAEVTLILLSKPLNYFTKGRIRKIVRILKHKTASQGAQFLSFDPLNGEWKFLVQHFSRFGLGEDEEDIVMNDVSPEAKIPTEMNDNADSDVDEVIALEDPTLLSHSLPAHLGLDPIRMKELRMLLFPAEEDEAEGDSPPFVKEPSNSPLHHSSSKTDHKMIPHLVRKTPLALIEYTPVSFSSNCQGSMLMAQQNKGLPLKVSTSEGFKLDLKHHKTPLAGSHSHIIVDAALFMGRSFRVGWGPNGVLVHSGIPVGSASAQCELSSVINLQKVANDKVIRDESNKVIKGTY